MSGQGGGGARTGEMVSEVRSGHMVDVLADAELIELTRSEEYRRKADHLSRATER